MSRARLAHLKKITILISTQHPFPQVKSQDSPCSFPQVKPYPINSYIYVNGFTKIIFVSTYNVNICNQNSGESLLFGPLHFFGSLQCHLSWVLYLNFSPHKLHAYLLMLECFNLCDSRFRMSLCLYSQSGHFVLFPIVFCCMSCEVPFILKRSVAVWVDTIVRGVTSVNNRVGLELT